MLNPFITKKFFQGIVLELRAIVDDYSRYTWVFFLKSKDETKITFIDFAKQAQRKFDKEIRALRNSSKV